jgi:hypothetical protein
MYNHNITIAEYSDYLADMAELNSINYIPTEEEMEEIYKDAQNRGLAE